MTSPCHFHYRQQAAYCRIPRARIIYKEKTTVRQGEYGSMSPASDMAHNGSRAAQHTKPSAQPMPDTKKGRSTVSSTAPRALCLSLTVRLSLLLRSHTLFSDAGLLTSEVAQVVQLSATYLTYLVHCDAVDVGRLNGENTLHAYSS